MMTKSPSESDESSDVFDRFSERWPKAGDRLLSSGRDAFLASDAGEKNYRLVRGYKRAGDILIEHALADRYDRDNLIFPALFSYRHYIELVLKAIIENHGNFAHVSLKKKNHQLSELWTLFTKISTAFGHDCSTEDVAAVGVCVEELAKIDGNAQVFRYATDKKGNTTLLSHDWIDLVWLRVVMNGIENFFECAELDFTHKEGLAAESLTTET